jgi:hypothetical protein
VHAAALEKKEEEQQELYFNLMEGGAEYLATIFGTEKDKYDF